MDNSATLTIDIERILRDKAGDKARRIPRFVVSWLKRIVHQDEVNGFLEQSAHLSGVEWLEACVDYLDMNLVLEGADNLPDPSGDRRYTFVSNHPLGGIDGVALGAILGRRYDGKIKYLVNDLLMNLPGLAPLCIPINKTGTQGRSFPAMVEAGFQSDDNIIMFPAGICSRRHDGVVSDEPWRKTFVLKSIETRRDVVPIHFGGHNSRFFYNLANLCKLCGVKFNVAMLFLVDEMYKNRHKTFTVKIGQPIPWQTFDKSRTLLEWAAWVRSEVYKL